ncbi:HAMP domain-containing protein [Desulfurispora thermophila]|uniref:HAMP domain-containing protein n=1 Tax=Desulfurispora thermophila TaxID=265470 RepID=UPI001FA80E63|nr:HAMP domain-containing protein [Desulfurispora thermophila]
MWKQSSIYYKINGIIMGILLLFSLSSWMLIKSTVMDLLGHQLEKRGQELGRYIAALVADDVLLDNYYNIHELINKTRSRVEDLRYILITDHNGRVIAHTFGRGLPQGLSQLRSGGLNEVIRFDSNEGFIREIMVPIENGNVGYVRVGMSEKSTRELLGRTTRRILLGIVLACSLAVLLATRLTSVIINPIYRLVKAAREIGRGQFAVRVPAGAQDEVGLLAAAFNEMAAGLQHKERENNLLLAELRRKEAMRTYLIQRLFTVQEEERRRISRELHDETSQSITSVLAYLKVLQLQVAGAEAGAVLVKVRDIVLNLLANVKKIAVELRPPLLDDHGIAVAMQKYIDSFVEQHTVSVTFTAQVGELALDSQTSLALYRILQEGLTNVARHARASAVEVLLLADRERALLVICDDGCGIAGGDWETWREKNHLGLYGMKERAELLGGWFHLCSGPGETIITVSLPPKWGDGRARANQGFAGR